MTKLLYKYVSWYVVLWGFDLSEWFGNVLSFCVVEEKESGLYQLGKTDVIIVSLYIASS